MVLLRAAFSAPKLLHTLRSSPCHGHPELGRFDQLLRSCVSTITNTDLTDIQWIQASLPVRRGGLGIRRVSSLAPSAFLASAAGTCDLQARILARCQATTDSEVDRVLAAWNALYNSTGIMCPVGQDAGNSASGTSRASPPTPIESFPVNPTDAVRLGCWQYRLPTAVTGCMRCRSQPAACDWATKPSESPSVYDSEPSCVSLISARAVPMSTRMARMAWHVDAAPDETRVTSISTTWCGGRWIEPMCLLSRNQSACWDPTANVPMGWLRFHGREVDAWRGTWQWLTHWQNPTWPPRRRSREEQPRARPEGRRPSTRRWRSRILSFRSPSRRSGPSTTRASLSLLSWDVASQLLLATVGSHLLISKVVHPYTAVQQCWVSMALLLTLQTPTTSHSSTRFSILFSCF